MALYDNDTLFTSVKDLAIIAEGALKEAYETSKKSQKPLGDVLLENGLISDENLGRVIAEISHLKFIKVSQVSIPDDILRVIPEVVAKHNKIIAFKKDEQGLHLAMANPRDLMMKQFIEKKTGIPVIVYYATEPDINKTLLHYTKNVEETFDKIISENISKAAEAKRAEPPIIKIVDTIITYAYQNKASDIHVEPHQDKSSVRFRIDGILHDIFTMPLDLHERVVTRIKVLSRLRTDEHQAPQDGKIEYDYEGERFDIRVSLVPVVDGEKIVMRILSGKSQQISLSELGFSPKDYENITKAYKKPYGMILASGPTGSGKTTTMYAILKLLNRRDVNIMTIEDPVEYELEGINQIQVNAKTNLTFAEGLRAIVRQDPNIVLVGEIRDQETASIAVNAAMTGHLVLSTIHTNDSATAIPRLFDMQIEPFLVASSVNVIVAQRLVRRIHPACRVSEEVSPEILQQNIGKELIGRIFGDEETIRVYKGKGCPICHNSGYEGRIGIYEVLLVDDELRQAITTRKDAKILRDIGIKNGMSTMIEDGLEKVKQGVTTVNEIIRVTKE